MADDLILRIDGMDHTGWTDVQIQRSLDQLADSFDIQLATKLSSSTKPIEILRDSACEILYGGELLLSGWVERVEPRYDANTYTFACSGRSRAGDLVDSSAIHTAWTKTPMLQVAQELCEPFGIRVVNETTEAPVEARFAIEQGETVFAALDRLARTHGMRVVSYPDGSVRFTRTGLVRYTDVVLEPGINVEEGGFVDSSEERFSRYIFRAQLAASDDDFGASACAVKYEVTDEGVARHRPLVIDTHNQHGAAKLEAMAKWERNTRAGKSRALQYTVVNPDDVGASWRHAYGVWEPNIVVAVRDPLLGVSGQFLVASVTLARGVTSGTRTMLSLVLPEAYDVKAPNPKKHKKGLSW